MMETLHVGAFSTCMRQPDKHEMKKSWEELSHDERRQRAKAVGDLADRMVARECSILGLDFDQVSTSPIAAIEVARLTS